MTPIRLVCAYAVLTGPVVLFGCTPVTALMATDENGTALAVRQEQHGNTLVVDLQDVTGHGELVLKRRNGSWPRHLVVRVSPNNVHRVLIRTEAGILFTPVVATDPTPRDISLQRGLYSNRTSQITVRWD